VGNVIWALGLFRHDRRSHGIKVTWCVAMMILGISFNGLAKYVIRCEKKGSARTNATIEPLGRLFQGTGEMRGSLFTNPLNISQL
jgi:hypothetical protein